MMPTSRPFLDAIDLLPVGEDVFSGVTQDVPWPKAYGGDLLVQAAASATRTVDADRTLHSMHSYFLSAADVGGTVRYEVERMRDGRSYSTREVRAYEDDRLLFVALASFHVGEIGGDYWPEMPTGVPAPETLQSSAESLARIESAAADYWSSGRSFDIRHVPSPIYLTIDGERSAHQATWLRAFSALPDEAAIHRMALIYVCDYTILEPVLRQQGRAWSDEGLVTASLDHSLWLHRDGRLDEWVLYTQRADSAQRGRGLATGSFFSQDGTLLATVSQEGMIRGG